MPGLPFRAFRRFIRDDTRGNVLVVLALSLIPLLGAMGAAMDYARAINARAELQSALDAGLLKAAHDLKAASGLSANEKAALEAKAAAHIRASITASGPNNLTGEMAVIVAATPEGLTATAQGHIMTTLLNILQIPDLPVTAHAATLTSGGSVEIALALDTTGSMAANMADLRTAAQELVNIITANGSNTQARIALIPYVGAVNIGNAISHEAWLDKTGTSTHHAQVLRNVGIALKPGCTGVSSEPIADRGKQIDGWLRYEPFAAVATAFAELIGVPAADAASPYSAADGECYYINPPIISHWTLFGALSNVTWKGCVEARPEPYDVDDTPPGNGNVNTRWVPYFWPDGNDPMPYVVDSINNYIPDGPFIAGTDMDQAPWGRAYSVLKYDGRSASIDDSPPVTRGPNKGCPDPILPLTNDYSAISSRISALSHYDDSGTNSADGVAWAMRVLSPGVPFTEGAPYGEVPKIMVLLSDGQNEILEDLSGSDDPDTMDQGGSYISHYSAYSSLRRGRFPEVSFASAYAYLDQRMTQACRNAKSAGIEIYVVAFGVGNPSALQKLTDCASKPGNVISLDRSGDLVAAFRAIAMKLSPIRLAR